MGSLMWTGGSAFEEGQGVGCSQGDDATYLSSVAHWILGLQVGLAWRRGTECTKSSQQQYLLLISISMSSVPFH